jgi:exosortase H (IPTLxxWG-CTERM-specific)
MRLNLPARFGLVFLALVGVFATVTAMPWVNLHLHQPLSGLIARISEPLLGILGDAEATGTYLTFDGFSAEVAEACNGIVPTYIYVAAVLAFPTGWRNRLAGIALGVPAIFVVNILRVLSLMLLGAYWPAAFNRVHIYVWQALVIALALGIWVCWAECIVRQHRGARA